MKTSKLADFSEIASSIAIVITLVYLLIEISQNTAAIEAQSSQAVLESAQTELAFLIEYPQITESLANQGPLSTTENIQVDGFLTMAFRAREFSWLQYQDGRIDQQQWETEKVVIISLLDSTNARLWWNRAGRNYFGQNFVAFIDNILEQNPATNSNWQAQLDWSSPEQ